MNVQCSIYATSAISEAVGDSGAVDCVAIVVEGGVIQSMAMGSGCVGGFNRGTRVFDPFTAWLAEQRPTADSTVSPVLA